MKVRLTLVLLLASLIFRPLSAEIKIYHRLGDVEEMADIYQAKDENVYVDARSLPEKVRSSITSNPEKFIKIDMRDVLSGRKVSEKGVVTYEQERFARHDSDLFEIVKLKKFVDMNTVADPSAKEKIKGAVEDFKHIGTAEKPAPEVMEAVEKRLLMELNKILGALDSTTKSDLGEEISKAIDTYLVEIEEQKGIVLKAFDSAIKRQQSHGDLEKMKACEAQKQNFLGGTLDAEQIADKTLKTTLKNYSKQCLSLQKSLLTSMNEEIKAQTKKGNVQMAEAIDRKKKEMIDDATISISENSSPAGFSTVVSSSTQIVTDRMVLWSQHNAGYRDRGSKKCNVVLSLNNKEVWRKDAIELFWSESSDKPTEIAMPRKPFDALKIEITEYHGAGGGLSEIELYAGKRNLAREPNMKASASASYGGFPPENIHDGIISSEKFRAGYWLLPDKSSGDVSLRWAPILKK